MFGGVGTTSGGADPMPTLPDLGSGFALPRAPDRVVHRVIHRVLPLPSHRPVLEEW